MRESSFQTHLSGGTDSSTFSISSARFPTRGRSAGAGARWQGCSPSGSRGDRRLQVVRLDRAGDADARAGALAALGEARGPAEESTFRRCVRLGQPGRARQVLGAWLRTEAARAGGRLVIEVYAKAVRGARGKDGKAPHLVAALAHGVGAVLGQVAVDAKSNGILAVSAVTMDHGRRARRTIKVALAPA